MPWKICFTLGNPKPPHLPHRICITVPILAGPRQIPIPDPPFFNHPEVGPEQIAQLQGLATIDELAGHLGSAGKEIQASVATHMKGIAGKLGEGSEISRV
jgi:hypothetical protein